MKKPLFLLLSLFLPLALNAQVKIPNVVGFWKGTSEYNDKKWGTSAMYFRITKQNGTQLEYVSVGTGSGSIDAKGRIHLHLGTAPYSDDIQGVVVGDTMKGTWTTYSGTVVSHGTFILKRQ
jgi:hypothetical protein